MAKRILVIVTLLTAVFSIAPAGAEEGRSVESGGDMGLTHQRSLTGNGTTMPHPGASQSDGTTSLDRGIEQNDDSIMRGICRGC